MVASSAYWLRLGVKALGVLIVFCGLLLGETFAAKPLTSAGSNMIGIEADSAYIAPAYRVVGLSHGNLL